MIAAGRVRVNGEVKTKMPVMVEVGKDIITVDEEEITPESAERSGAEGLQEQKKVYFLLNKPKGILVTTSDPSGRKTVGELMAGVKERVFPVGRLDMDSRGALIMTNGGELANRLTHPKFGIEKTYIVEVDGRLGHGEIEKIKRGMWLGPVQRGGLPAPGARRPGGMGAVKTDRFHVRLVGRERGRTIMEIKLSEAKNREIRRVMARIGHNVRDLNRVAIAGKVTIKNLEVGKFRPLSEAEVKWLLKASSPEFHQSEKAATQAWYEAKEMEKERKRLAREAEEGPKEVEDQHVSAEDEADERPAGGRREREERRARPERKGRKPFVPPSGRNAGKMLGGDFRGRKRVEQQAFAEEGGDEESPPKMEGSNDLPSHPLGGAAGADE